MTTKLPVLSRNDIGHSSLSVIMYWLQRDCDFDCVSFDSPNVFDLVFFVLVPATVSNDGNWYLYKKSRHDGIFSLGHIKLSNFLTTW